MTHHFPETDMRVYRHTLPLLAALLALAACPAPAFAQVMRVVPPAATVPVGTSRQLSAILNGSASTAVTWSVNGIRGGNSRFGFIDRNGKYMAPSIPPDGWEVTVEATSRANPSASAACAITVRHQTPALAALNPSKLPLGPFTLQVHGSRFVNGARVLWNGTPLPTAFKSSALLLATGDAKQVGSVRIAVANPGPETVSAPAYIAVRAEPSRTSTPTKRATRTATLPPTGTHTRERTSTIPPTATRTMVRSTATRTMAASTPTRTPMATETQRPPATRTAMATSTTVPTGVRTMEPVRTPTPTPMRDASGTPGMRTATRTGLIGATPTPGSTGGSTRAPAPATATPDPLAVTHGRLLDQATFGHTRELMAHLAQIGIPAFIEEQFAMPESPWPPLAGAQRSDAIEAFFGNALRGQDQLRQRVLFALSEIIVESSNKNTNADEIIPWLQLLSRNAFGNYRTLLRDITLDGSMGKYLDLANSGMMGGAANENYPREVMQLFSIGLHLLNPDGSVQVDAHGTPLPTYTQADVQNLAKALTGWTWGNPSGTPPAYRNSNYYPGPMLPVAAYHDISAKTILGRTLPAGQSIEQDLENAIDIIFEHPNVGPFVATRLIRALVTSNPSRAYIARVAAAFNGPIRGDMKAVIRAILLDPEARNDTPPADFGRLRTPMQHTIALARALALDPGAASQFAYLFSEMNESLLDAPSVFGHYSPMYRLPISGLFGPEFQIYSASDAITRANLMYALMYSPWPIDPALQPFVAVAADPEALVNAVDAALLYGRMLPATRTALLNAIPAMPDNNARALTAVYLTSMSGEYLVQR
ncbi:MAG: DUF1800 family protein [Candidatus Binatia bacterium]